MSLNAYTTGLDKRGLTRVIEISKHSLHIAFLPKINNPMIVLFKNKYKNTSEQKIQLRIGLSSLQI